MALTASKSGFYTDPLFNEPRQVFAGEAGGGATTEYTKFRTFLALKLKAAHAVVTTAGTTTGHGFDVYHGTTSIGSIALSTNTAGVAASLVLSADRSIAQGDQLSVKSLADATGKAHVVFEYWTDPATGFN